VSESLHSNTYWESFACEIQCEEVYDETDLCNERKVNESPTEKMRTIRPSEKLGEVNKRNLIERILNKS